MLGLRPLPRTLAAALRDAQHEKPDVRRSALADLSRFAQAGQGEAQAALARALTEDPSDDVRARAAIGLADADVRSAIDALLASVQREQATRVRQLSVLALGELAERGDERVTRLLAEVWGDPEAPVRFQALLALHQLAGPQAERVILEAMTDPDPEIRRLAYRLCEAQFADAALPDLARARARAALNGSEPGVKVTAALALARFGDPSGEGTLIAIVAGRQPGATFEDQQAAIDVVARLELERAVPWLERRAFGLFARDALSFDARIALARLGHARAQGAILQGLSGLSFRVRTLAAEAAGRARLESARPALQALLRTPERAEAEVVERALARLDGREEPERHSSGEA
jgi:HEAT repeat protein